MTSESKILFAGKNLTVPILRALKLPENTWQLVLNQSLTGAAYMDRSYRVYHIAIDDLGRHSLRKALRDNALWDNAAVVA